MAFAATTQQQEWRIWHAVPEGYSGVWRTVDVRGWTYYGGFANGRLVVGVGLDPTKDEDTKAAWLAMLEVTMDCSEPKVMPILPPARVLPFPATLSRGA